jgi:two-component system sensor kinase FixL
MSWLTLTWTMMASASLTFALIHLFIVAKGINPGTNLSFSATAVGIALITLIELRIMYSHSLAQAAWLLRWVQLPLFMLFASIICFVRYYFGTGRLWLALATMGLRLLALILSFTTGQNLFFQEISGLKQVMVWGDEIISIPQGTLNPWYFFGPLSTLFLVDFVIDAAISLWRRGTAVDRRRTVLFSIGIIAFALISTVSTLLIHAGVINSPYMVGSSFMLILLAMAYELSCDMLHSMQIMQQLKASQNELKINKQRIQLAASAADLRLWEWDMVRDEIWSTDRNHALYGLNESEKINFDRWLHIIHEDDRERIKRAVMAAKREDGNLECEYRIKMADGSLRWVNSRGRIEFSDAGQPVRMLGVTMDITRRKQAQMEAQQQREEIAHLSRVNLLGELSGSLAHELNQPLTAILANAQAAKRFLAQDRADIPEVSSILDDIISEDHRAGDIIQRLRLLLKKGDVQHTPLDLNKTIADVLKLIHSDLVHHNITLSAEVEPNLPAVSGDRVQLQQVLLNLIMNACDAMSHNDVNSRRMTIRAKRIIGLDKVEVSVFDQGPGISPDSMQKIFEPFYSTKSHGMGLGLPICRTIIRAHKGELWATNNHPKGAAFHFALPVFQGGIL